MTLRTAIVTGAASGIGALAVQRLRARGVNVVAADRTPALTGLYAGDRGIVTAVGDVTDPSYAPDLVRTAETAFGPVDQLFHSAGIMPAGEIGDIPIEQFLTVVDVNYIGTVRMTRAVLPSMRERRSGQIIVLGSITGYIPSKGFAAYSASKAAVNSYTETLDQEERGHGIHVLLVAPNAVKTPLLGQMSGGPAAIAALAQKESSPLMITPDKVLDDIERALARRRHVCLPGARAAYALRRLSPALTWALNNRLNQV
ncbi:SDR family NAD(P)-dependent oxidoreductase [Cystobacter fuscus]|uniref:SDR family NAD(P)-dependent oxidoreductase n=1 Tax=Cystobacter fuscus TaxID=43 RepID=UPI002B2DD68F|nr:SDR family oxidoreductase [Cystobacter fuscus]